MKTLDDAVNDAKRQIAEDIADMPPPCSVWVLIARMFRRG